MNNSNSASRKDAKTQRKAIDHIRLENHFGDTNQFEDPLDSLSSYRTKTVNYTINLTYPAKKTPYKPLRLGPFARDAAAF